MNKKRIGSVARSLCALTVVALAAVASQPVHGGLIGITADLENRHRDLGELDGTIEYVYESDLEAGTLRITLTNTSPAGNGGYITGFIFNMGGAESAVSATLTSAPPKFEDAYKRNGGPFGKPYDAGATIRGRFFGGGNPHRGIGVGQTRTFEFRIDGAGAPGLSAESFISGPFAHNFIVRFRGFEQGGGDIVPVQLSFVPGPSALMMLAVLTVISRWRRRPTLQ